MSTPLAVALYFVIWWITLFACLPLGVRTQDDAGEVVPGTPGSAPAKPRLVRVFLINTVVATTVFVLLLLALTYKIVNVEAINLPDLRGGR